jgi:hypothetical protein
VKAAYPGARAYASSALDDALKGFLATYRGQLLELIDNTPDPVSQKPWRAEIALIDAGHALGPDELVSASRERLIAGRKFRINLEPHAVTAADVWLFDPRSRVLAAGDLVTLPAPFLDMACPQGWNSALDHVAATDFSFVVPGHGAPMRRKAFESYRTAFGNLLACGASTAPKESCVAGWTKDAAELLTKEDPKFVSSLMNYYVGILRDSAQTERMCRRDATGGGLRCSP